MYKDKLSATEKEIAKHILAGFDKQYIMDKFGIGKNEYQVIIGRLALMLGLEEKGEQ